ncbi:hypothetical protein E2493_12475 [Sphingomonas parva]|uniref:Uncharacterized protein n=1 Tax=Sphingomonas parva TaxID=2555898 RepID=A0A4Y8ZPW8_9SPHN|nr:hypothetical protein [Sphingomonas parva]TFI58004.1 hypothetical protein E2493_12475 [Sphingomonas parva]
MRAFYLAFALAAAAGAVAASPAAASQTTRRPGPCNVNSTDTVVDSEVVDLGRAYQPSRRTGAKLQVGGNITDVVWVMNHSNCPVTISKQGYGVGGATGEFIEVPPRGSYEGHFWVPWRDTPVGQSMWISIAGRPYFYVWQMAGRLAFQSDAAYQRAAAVWDGYRANYGRSPSVPGLSIEGGRRILHVDVTDDGKPFFKFEGMPEE